MPLFWTWTQALPSSLKNKKNFRNCFSQHEVIPSCGPISLGTCRDLSSVRIAGGLGVDPPTSPCRPPTSGQNSTPGGSSFNPPTYVLLKLVCCLIHTSF